MFIIFSLLLFSIIFFLIISSKDNKANASDISIEEKKTTVKSEKNEVKEELKEIIVEIKGAVANPGVYSLKENSRVIDLINLAGGFIEGANTDYINQSKTLTDEMVIKIYTNDEIEQSNRVEVVTKYVEKECNCPKINNDACLNNDNISENNDNPASSNNHVNINKATLEELLTLPGIGESKALSIINYRNINGNYNSIEDIKNVSGIGTSLYEKIKEYIEV